MAAWYAYRAADKNRVYRSLTYQSRQTSVYKKGFRLENTTNARKSVYERLGPCPDQRSIDNKNDHPGTSGENEPKRRTTKRAWNAKGSSVNNKIDHHRSTGQSAFKRVIIKRTWNASYEDKNKVIPDEKASKPEVINRDITVSSTDQIKVTVKRIAEVTSVHQNNLADLRDKLHRVRKQRVTTDTISNPTTDCDFSSKGSKTSTERLRSGNQNAGPSTKKGIQTEFSEEMRSSELASTSFTTTDGKHQSAGKEHSGLSENGEVTKSLFDEINKYSSHFQISQDREESDSLDLVTDTGYVPQYNYEFSHHPIHKSHWSVKETEDIITNTLCGNGNSFRESFQWSASEKPTMNLTEGKCQQQSRKRKAPSTDDWAIQAPPAKRARLMMSCDITDLSPISFDHTVIASRTSDDLTDGKRRKRKAPSDENWVTEASPAKRSRLMMSSDVTDLWFRKGDSPISFDHTAIGSRTSDDFTDGKRASRKRKAPSDENWVTEASPTKRARLMSPA